MAQKLNIKVSVSSSTNPPLLNSFHAQELRENDLLAEQVLHEILEYHRTHRLRNTTKAYAPKYKECQVCFLHLKFFFLNLVYKYLKMVQAPEIYFWSQASSW